MTTPLRVSAAPACERFTATFMDVTGLEHLHRYQLASLHAQDTDVLDIACGACYGSCMLAQGARRVFGVDASAEVIAHASDRYYRDNFPFHQGFCADIPLDMASVFVIVTIETAENIIEYDEFPNERPSVLRPNDVLIISLPNLEHLIEYKPPVHYVFGMFQEPLSVLDNSVLSCIGAYYGFESIIWAFKPLK